MKIKLSKTIIKTMVNVLSVEIKALEEKQQKPNTNFTDLQQKINRHNEEILRLKSNVAKD
jgi:chaperonin cofactor prefoldin